MKKQKKQLILLLVLLAVMLAAYFGAERYATYTQQKEADLQEASRIWISGVAAADITALSYDYNAETCSFVKEGEIWVATEDKELSIKQSSIEAMTEKLELLEAIDVVEGVTDLEQYGLKEPDKKIRFTAGDVTKEIWQGTYNTTASVYYVCDAADTSVVYTVQTTALTSFNYGMDSLVEEAAATE